MRVIKCDRCGCEAKEYSVNIDIEFENEKKLWDADRRKFQTMHRALKDKDLCIECALKLADFMRKREG